MVPLHKAHHARPLQLGGRESTPQRRSHTSSLRAVHRPPSISICGATNGCDPSILFVNTTEGLIVMAFKLCQEGNREPLIERIVLRKWIVGIEMPVHADSRMRHNLTQSQSIRTCDR